MNLEQIKQDACIQKYEHALQLAVQMINTIKKNKSIADLKKILLQLDDEESFYLLIRVLDYGLMYQYSNFLARVAYKKHATLWSLTWSIDLYLEQGNITTFEKELKRRIDAGELELYSVEIQGKILFTYVQVLMELKKWEEAEEILTRMQQNEEITMAAKWGYFYLEQDEREKAKTFFLQGRQSAEDGIRCSVMVAQIEAMEGNHEISLSYIEEGLTLFGPVPDLILERIRRYRDLQQYRAMYSDIMNLSQRLPDCFYHGYLAKLSADYYYEKHDFSSLTKLIAEEKSLIDLPYHQMKEDGKQQRIALNALVQKSNYCVPASLSMILRKYGTYKQQDEIAESIFNKVGSKLSTTVDYWESIGYTCRYITADLYTLKKCLDLDIPILISINVGLFSHVQVVTGYDDRLEIIYIQDPNTLETLFISYEEYLETYYITNYLGIIGLPQAQCESLSQINVGDHYYYQQLFEFLELMENDDEKYISELEAFLKQHWDHAYTKLFIIKHLHDNLVQSLFDQAVSELEEASEQSETSIMHIVNGYLNFDEIDHAKAYLKRVEKKKMSGFYHLLRGRIAYEEDNYEESIFHFKQSLKYDTEDAVTWSYLALSYLYDEEPSAALEASTVAIEINDEAFIIYNHCKILLANQLYTEALNVLENQLNEKNRDAYWFYLQAQIFHGLQETDSAIEALQQSIELQPDFGGAYLLLADLLDEEKSDVSGAVSLLQTALSDVDDRQEIWIRLGQIYLDEKQYEKACLHFQSCIDEYPQYAFGYVKYADTMIDRGLIKEARDFFLQYESIFIDDIEFIMNAGIVFLNHHEGQADVIQKGLHFLERGIPELENNWEEPLRLYYSSLMNHHMAERGIVFLSSLINEKHPLSFAFLTYKGMLLHASGDEQGISFMKESFDMKQHVITAYQLGEAYLTIGKKELAKEAFQYCLEQKYDDGDYLTYLNELVAGDSN